ncbi:MAG: IspD/TarI family cytidylyltransferase [Planctomycetota bacterium]|nr:IspD/TarI family cytidylyltransferase [Planctomycetota bacterium]MDA1105792.1 IspD/TarI family cytidylyltransferase [Planctomycetota bacterium]
MSDPDMKICLIVTAAGSSQRFGADKLGEDLGGRPVLLRAVEPFTKRTEVTTILVAAPPDSIDAFTTRFGPTLLFHGVRIVPGGRTARWETVKAALAYVPEDCTHVAIHDGARPCVSNELLDRLFAAAAIAAAVVPGLEVSDTVKRVGAERVAAAEDDALADAILGDAGCEAAQGRLVEATLPRDGLVLVQTPQVFARGVLCAAYSSVDLHGATDDASVVERAGHAVMVVDGDPRNIKVTTKADLALARIFSNARAPAATDRADHLRF